MIQKTLIVLSALVAGTALAHIDPGTWKGVTPSGASCSMLAGEQFFEGGKKHPLNERIRIRVGQDDYVIAHPPVIDATKDFAFFNHDVFHAVLPQPTGARALVIDMVHEEGREGPTAFHVIDHNWKTGQRQAIHCLNLTKSE